MTSREDRNARRRASYARLKQAGYSVRDASRLSGSEVRSRFVERAIEQVREANPEVFNDFIPETHQNLIQLAVEDLGARPSRPRGVVETERFPTRLREWRLGLSNRMPQKPEETATKHLSLIHI